MRHLLPTSGIAFLAACASQSGSKPPISAPASPPIAVTGGVLVYSGMTLYTFDRDIAGSGRSNCNGECAFMWPPLQAAAGAKPSRDFGIITRAGGERQWAYKGKPLYLFSGDANPGDSAGNGVNGVWKVATP